MKVYVWPDGSARSSPASDMSDDYIVIDSESGFDEVVMKIWEHFDDSQANQVLREVAECILSE